MKSEVLAHFPLTGLTCMAFLLFFFLFIGVCIWVYLKFNQKKYDYLANLPLKDDFFQSKNSVETGAVSQ